MLDRGLTDLARDAQLVAPGEKHRTCSIERGELVRVVGLCAILDVKLDSVGDAELAKGMLIGLEISLRLVRGERRHDEAPPVHVLRNGLEDGSFPFLVLMSSDDDKGSFARRPA